MARKMILATVPLLLTGCDGNAPSSNAAAAEGTSHPHAAGGWSESQPTPPPPVGKQGEATFLITLRDRLIAVGAKLYGAPVTGLRTAGTCAATMTTEKGATTFRWADIGDLAVTERAG